MQSSSSLGREAQREGGKERDLQQKRGRGKSKACSVHLHYTRSPRPNPCRETQPFSSDQSTHAHAHTCTHAHARTHTRTHSPKQGQKAEKMGTMPPSHASARCESTRTKPISNRSSVPVFPEIKCTHTHEDTHTVHTHTNSSSCSCNNVCGRCEHVLESRGL